MITAKEVWNYLYLTNQVIISPREKAQVQGLGFSPQTFGDLKALAKEVSLRLVVTDHGLVAALNDLHKGRDTPGSWKAFLDISALFLALVSLTAGLTRPPPAPVTEGSNPGSAYLR